MRSETRHYFILHTSDFILDRMAHTGDTVLILDFGSQYTQLIARRVRELGVYAEILPCTAPLADIEAFNPKAIILSGSPSSVYAPDAPRSAPEIFPMGKPILGLCYGLQLMAHELGGNWIKARAREYGRAEIIVDDKNSEALQRYSATRESLDVPRRCAEQASAGVSHHGTFGELPAGRHREYR